METNGTEVARLEGGAVVVQDPFSPEVWHRASDVAAMIGSARSRLAERRAELDALGDLAAAPLEAVRDLRKAVEADDKALREFDGKMKDALMEISGFKAFAVQTRGAGTRIDPLSVRGGFAAIASALKAREDAAKPDAPKHTYFYAVTATDAEHAAIRRAIDKADPNFAWAAIQGDDMERAAERLFNWGGDDGADGAAKQEGGAE